MPRKKKQPDLPGDGFAAIERPEIEEPAEDLRAIRQEIASLNEKKRASAERLHEALTAAGLQQHKYVDADGVPRVAKLRDRPGVAVERDKSASSGDDGDGGVEVE